MNTSDQPVAPSWIKRHLAWVIALGVGGGLLISALLIVIAIFGWIKSSDAYQLAFARAAADSRVLAALGTPVESGILVSGNIAINGPSGSANLSIPVSGPKGKGTIYLRAQKSLGEWSLQALVFENEATHERSDLLSSGTAPASQMR